MGHALLHQALLLALALAVPLVAQESSNPALRKRTLPARVGPNALSGHDRADLRRDWNLTWFGGRLSPEYLDYKNLVAGLEVQKWRHILPAAPGARVLTAAGAGTPTWVNLGPTSDLTNASFPSIDSGRLVAIVPDPTTPTTLYLATSGGGVFKCTNADVASASDWTWTAITDSLPTSSSGGNVSIGAMAISPVNSTVLYVGLGDPFDAEGRGFYRSTDAGANWTAATGLGSATRSHAILPLSATRILWTTNDGLKISNDGGATFMAATGGPATGDVWSIQKLTATDLICSVQGTAGLTYYSADAGSTWTLGPMSGVSVPVGRITLAAATDGATAYGILEDTTNTASSTMAPGVIRTNDKGHTWTWMAAPPTSGSLFKGTGGGLTSDGGQGWYNHGLGVDPTDANRLVVGANLALYRSLDGGATWSQLTHWYGSLHPYAHADFHTTAWSNGTLFLGNDGGLAVVRDPWRPTPPTGEDLTFIDNRRNKGLTSHLVYSLGSTTATSPADARWRVATGMQDNGTRVRQGSGTALQTSGVFEDRIGGDGFGTLIHPTNGNLMLGSLYYTQIYRSTNGGTSSFTPSSTGIAESNDSNLAPFAPRIALGPLNEPDTVYTFTNGKVYQSSNFAALWSALPTTNLPPAGTNSISDPTNALYIRNFGAASGDANALGIAANQGRVFLSYNRGTTWAQAGTLPNNASYTSSITFDPADAQTVYVSSVAPNAAKNHLWKTVNGGTSWVAIDGSSSASNGLPFGIPVHVVKTVPGSPGTLYAGTDFGVYTSGNGGTTWTRFGTGLPLVAVRDLYIAPDSSFLRAATFGRGVWEVQAAAAGPALTLAPTTATVVHGGTQTFTPTVTSGTANTVTWVATAGTVPTTATASGTPQTYLAPGSGTSATLTATTVDTPAASTTATVTLVAPSAVTVAVTPPTVEQLVGSGTQQFTGSVTPLTNTAVTWSITGGTGLSGTGLFSANGLTAGTYTVTATSLAAPSRAGTGTVTLVSPSAVTVTVTAASYTTLIGATQQFSAAVTGLSVPANQTVTWGTSGGGAINATGLFTPTTVGNHTITATNTFSGRTGTATSYVRTLDLNGDGVLDLLDLLTLARNHGSTTNVGCDLVPNGRVDDADLAFLLTFL